MKYKYVCTYMHIYMYKLYLRKIYLEKINCYIIAILKSYKIIYNIVFFKLSINFITMKILK